MPGGVDPIYQQQQQQFFYNKGLERAKKAQREHKSSKVKLWAVLLIVFLLAAAAVFILSGGMMLFAGHRHVMVDGISYRVGEGQEDIVVSMEEGFVEAGKLYYTEDWKNSEENFATDWDYETSVYVNPNDRSKVYFRWQGHYLKCKRERSFFSK